MIPIQNQKTVLSFNLLTTFPDGFTSEGFLGLVEQGVLPSRIEEILRSVNRILSLLDAADATISPKERCLLLGTLDCHVFSLRLASDEMESSGHSSAPLVSVLATEVERRADAEAHEMLRSFQNKN